MVDIIRCKEQLLNLYSQQPTLENYLSKLTRQARGEQKADCLQAFGTVQDVQHFLLHPEDIQLLPEPPLDIPTNSEEQPVIKNDQQVDTQSPEQDTPSASDQQAEKPTTEHAAAQTTGETQTGFLAQAEQSWDAMIVTPFGEYVVMGGYIIGGIVLAIALWKSLLYLLEFLYDVLNAKRMIFLKVMLPRSDSKLDREKEKELAKDMKEKIARMSQVFRNLHKLGELSLRDTILQKLCKKPKITLVLQYEDGMLHFLIGTYPEYLKIIESSLSAQYSDASLEVTQAPKFFSKKYNDLIPLETVKQGYYPIRIFKQLEDDPLNNVIDAMGKISSEDTCSLLITIKPLGDDFNKKAQKLADALYRKDEAVTKSKPLRKRLLPWNLFTFLIRWPSQALIEKYSTSAQKGDPIIRMVKAEEDALNIMAEEAGKQAYESGILLITSSSEPTKLRQNMQTVLSSFTVYKDEYNNELDQPAVFSDLFGRALKPMWRFSALFHLVNFFYKDCMLTVSALASLFHLPDGLFNRAPIIKWMDYKVISAPDNLPTLEQENNLLITWEIAEGYLGGNLSDILAASNHPAIGTKTEITTTKKELTDPAYVPKQGETIIQEEGKAYLLQQHTHTLHGLKTYNDGILLGINAYRNTYTPVYMKKKDRTRHQYIIGKSGTGKSVFISMLARQDIRAGNGICVIDPHGDLVEDVLRYVPKERAKDVIYFDAGDEERPMGLNLYEIDHIAQADRAVNDATEIFLKMFGPEIFGPRIQEYFKYGSLTLLEDMEDGATLIDVPRLFTDEVYREYKVKKTQNPVVRNFWDKTYSAMGDREKQEIIPYFTSKFVSFITNSLIRNIIGQTKSAFNFRDVMDNRKILLINLSKGKIGEMNSQLLGMIIVSKIYNAAMSRANIDESLRKDFYLYVDEFQNFITDTFADILSEARKYKLGLVMAHQYIAQLDSNSGNNIGESKSQVKDAVFGNVGTMMSFKVGAPDAEFLEKEYAPVLSAQDILGIANYKAYLKLNINNSTSRVFSFNAINTSDYRNDKIAAVLKEYCAKKYGRKKEFVDAEIAARIGIVAPSAEEAAVDQTLPESTGEWVADGSSPAAEQPEQNTLSETPPEQTNEPPTPSVA